MFVICYVGLSGVVIDAKSSANPGEYLMAYDPEAHGGRGRAEFTDDLSKAMVFKDISSAYRCIFQVPVRRPRREDGKPNMPLRAFTLEVSRLNDHLS
jgi:hypothetical protein